MTSVRDYAPSVRLVDSVRGALLTVRVIPRASRTRVEAVRNDALLIRVTASPTEGAANDAVRKVLAGFLDVPPTRLKIVTGTRGRVQRILIEGVSAAIVRGRIDAHAS